MESRLNLENEQLVKIINSATEIQQRKIAKEVSQFAINKVNIDNEDIDKALAYIGKGMINNDPIKTKIQSILESLDDIQWDLQELFNAGKISEERYLSAFNQARAVNSLFYVFDNNSQMAALESTYEALIATDSETDIEKIILMITSNGKNDS